MWDLQVVVSDYSYFNRLCNLTFFNDRGLEMDFRCMWLPISPSFEVLILTFQRCQKFSDIDLEYKISASYRSSVKAM